MYSEPVIYYAIMYWMQKTTSLPIESLRKRFHQGDHVKVVNGRHKDETGLVVKVTDSIVTLISDVSMKEASHTRLVLFKRN
jgi:transcription elongation factor